MDRLGSDYRFQTFSVLKFSFQQPGKCPIGEEGNCPGGEMSGEYVRGECPGEIPYIVPGMVDAVG